MSAEQTSGEPYKIGQERAWARRLGLRLLCQNADSYRAVAQWAYWHPYRVIAYRWMTAGPLGRKTTDKYFRTWQAEWSGCERAVRAWTRGGVERKADRQYRKMGKS